MESDNKRVYGLVKNKKSNVERNNIINYLKNHKPRCFITSSEISDFVIQDDHIVASSVTDLGHNTDVIMKIITLVLDKNASITFTEGNLCFIPEDKPSEIVPKIGRIYTMFRSNRSAIGLSVRKEKGLSIGRRPGKAKKLKLDQFEIEIIESLSQGVSKTELCKNINASRSTLNDWLKARGHFNIEKTYIHTDSS